MAQVPTTADLRACQALHDRYHDMVKIDKYRLDDELAEQAEKYRDVLDCLAQTISYHAAAKDNFDQVEAELDQAEREAHERKYSGVEKAPRLTDTAVRKAVMTDGRWVDAKEIRRQWEHMLQQMNHLKEVFMQRSSNMKELPTLYAAGYWVADSSDGRSRSERQADHVRREIEDRRQRGAVSQRGERLPERRQPRG